MYNVARLLQTAVNIAIYEPNQWATVQGEVHPLKNTEFCLSERTVAKLHRKDVDIPKAFDECYNNGYFKVPGLKTEIEILQDYGNNEGLTPEGYLELWECYTTPLVAPSICWYDGFLSLIGLQMNEVKLYKLLPHKRILYDDIRPKRPFNIKYLVEQNNLSLESKIIMRIYLHHKVEESEVIDYEYPYVYGDIMNHHVFNLMMNNYIQTNLYAQPEKYKKAKSIYIDELTLIHWRFSYDGNTNVWSKDQVRFEIDIPGYWRLAQDSVRTYSREDDVYVWYKYEVDALLHGGHFEFSEEENDWVLVYENKEELAKKYEDEDDVQII